ncbi:hypothetical protein LY71_104289 [Geodermatophilus tzadiensis]|uniref:Uncharacterized protein n=1 Tax=Geodermatophilus tzadiensis TaxID=1137988 RepID=A0A2T0TX23_9ACTN|nr:hypothetical protein [Geodermatophilus tzadiensis]PRY50252.1 hypothetical protein LY71_104289 [Geodermatophilus tzadiensis]
MRRTVLLAACLTLLAGCGPGGVDAAPRAVAAGTSTPAPVVGVGDTVAFTDPAGGGATITLDGVRRVDRADSSQLVAEVTVAAADGAVPVDPLRFRAQTVEGATVDPGDGVVGRRVADGIAFDVPEGAVLISYLDPDGEVLVAFRVDPASQAPAEDEVDYPPFACDMGVDGIPVCEGDVPDSVGVYRTPDGVLVGD